MMDFSHILNDIVAQILLILMALGLIVLCVYYGVVFLKLSVKIKQKNKNDGLKNEDLPSVSVVLVSHNSSYFLKENLVYILEQDYPDFEVVVVDYLSGDDTHYVLKLLQENYPKLKIVQFKNDVNLYTGKKYPLSIGIQSAKNDMIVLTEPNCKPGLQWLRGLMEDYKRGRTDIVLGYCKMETKKNLLGSLQQYDNLLYSASYLSAALSRRPFTGNGRNLSYGRDYFFRKGAFIKHYAVRDGADDMFVNQNATKRNTEVSLRKEGYVAVAAARNFSLWRQERQHRCVTYTYHSFGQKLRRALPGIGVVLFYGAAVALLVMGLFPWQILAGLLVIKLAWQIVTFAQLEKAFGEKNLCYAAPFFEIYFMLSNTIMAIFPLKYKKYSK